MPHLNNGSSVEKDAILEIRPEEEQIVNWVPNFSFSKPNTLVHLSSNHDWLVIDKF